MMYSGTIESKTGELIPLFTDGKPMHSKYNPHAEETTFASSIQTDSNGNKPGCIVAAGLGGAFHLAQLVKDGILVFAVEADKESLAFCTALPSVTQLLQYPNFIPCTESELCSNIMQHYLPQVQGSITFVPHRAWEDRAIVSCSNMRTALEQAVKQIAADYSVQAHFGKLWQRNILLNLKQFTQEPEICSLFDTKKTAAVIAAGPSLDQTIQELITNRNEYCIFATDTALSILRKKNISCDAVVSIDAQHVSLSHFENLQEKNNALPRVCFFDAASCPESLQAAQEAGCTTVLVHTGHPLVQLAQKYAYIPRIQAGSGTVTIAACDIARKLGFEHIQLLGADFAYHNGKPYAKGTYLDQLYNNKAGRTIPAEQSFASLMYRTPLVETGENRLTTEVLDGYRKTLEDWAKANGYTKTNALLSRKESVPQQDLFSFGKDKRIFNFESFIKTWKSELDVQFNANGPSLTPYLMSLLPLVAYFQAKDTQKNSFFGLAKLAYSYSLRYTE